MLGVVMAAGALVLQPRKAADWHFHGSSVELGSLDLWLFHGEIDPPAAAATTATTKGKKKKTTTKKAAPHKDDVIHTVLQHQQPGALKASRYLGDVVGGMYSLGKCAFVNERDDDEYKVMVIDFDYMAVDVNPTRPPALTGLEIGASKVQWTEAERDAGISLELPETTASPLSAAPSAASSPAAASATASPLQLRKAKRLAQEAAERPPKALILHAWCVYPDGVRLVRAPNTIRRSSMSNFESMSIQREPVIATATDSLRSTQSLCERLVQLEREEAREEEE